MQADTGTKMIHIGKNTRSNIITKGIAVDRSSNTYRGCVKVVSSSDNARNYTRCDSLLVGSQCAAHTIPTVEAQNGSAQLEHEATMSRLSDDQMFYFRSRGIGLEDAMTLIISGFCGRVLENLPLEFAQEAKNLLALKLEHAVG